MYFDKDGKDLEASYQVWQEPSSETAQENEWREEEKWAEEAQPLGPYKEEPAVENSEAWAAMSGEAAGDLKTPESETATLAEEQLWDAPEWEEQPESDWATSAEKPVADSEYKQVSALCPCIPTLCIACRPV